MIGLDELDCLDYLIWLRTGDRVAKRLNMDQASVSRKARRAVAAFGLYVKKSSGEWDVEGDLSLLNMERQVHQDCRWKFSRLRSPSTSHSPADFLTSRPKAATARRALRETEA